jgi:hypothetical protein
LSSHYDTAERRTSSELSYDRRRLRLPAGRRNPSLGKLVTVSAFFEVSATAAFDELLTNDLPTASGSGVLRRSCRQAMKRRCGGT